VDYQMTRIRHGVIGLGFFGEYHADVARSMPQMELVAVCTRTESRLNQIAAKFNVPKKYTGYRELLDDPDIDSVSMVTHFHDHKHITRQLLV
jgi:UDP-N-acetylglucosamine 3-dehydrogenase